MGNRSEKRLSSGPASLHEVEKFIEHVSDEFHLNNTYYGNMLIAVTEAIKNAIDHGNQADESKTVRLVFEVRKEGLAFVITDHGIGFNFSEYEDLEKLMNSDQYRGNGMVLIHSLSDEVRFSDGGRTIELLFRVNGIDERIMESRFELMQQYMKVMTRMQNMEG